MNRHIKLWAALVFVITTVGCADDEPKSNNQTTGDAGQDAMTDADISDAGIDATQVDMGPEPEFFADYELLVIEVQDSLPQIEFFVVVDGRNNGPDDIVIDTCSWNATRDSDGELLGEGEIPLCDGCNPIEPNANPMYSTKLQLEPGDNPGTVPATLSVTCLPTGLYEDTDPSNNTLTDTFTY